MKANTKQMFEFDPEVYSNNIACEYDLGNHPILPVYQQCSRCKFVKNQNTPLCIMCGFHKNGLKLCNQCFEETSEAKQALEKLKETING